MEKGTSTTQITLQTRREVHGPPKKSRLKRRVPGKIIDAKFLFYGFDAGDHMLETVFPEQLVFLVLEGVAQRIILVFFEHLVKCRKKHGIFAACVGTIHTDELPEAAREPAPVFRIPQGLGTGKPERDGGETPPCLMLPQEHVNQVSERADLFHAWKKILLLQLLVIILDKRTDYPG